MAFRTCCTPTTAAISRPVTWSRSAPISNPADLFNAGETERAGRIERFFTTVDEMFLCELDGYAPSRGRVRGKRRLTLAELDSRLRTFLLDVYHRRKCAETKTPPAERWEASGFLPRMPESLEQLDLLLI